MSEALYIVVELKSVLNCISLFSSFSKQAYLSRVAYYGLKGRYSKAILNCNEAIRLYPESVRAYICRGVLKYYNRVSCCSWVTKRVEWKLLGLLSADSLPAFPQLFEVRLWYLHNLGVPCSLDIIFDYMIHNTAA